MRPLVRQVLVPCDPATARALFLDEIGTWWPLESHGCFGAGASLAVVGREIVETAPDGRTAVWGTLDDGEELAFSWHPGQSPTEATHVALTFLPAGASTLVTLTHTGWERRSEAARGEYAHGWLVVLGRYSGAVAAPADGESWFVLEHTAGPATPSGGVFSSPDFGKHLAFLRELDAAGVLVAGGPLPDTPGGGMTIVRMPDAVAAVAVVHDAQASDGAVLAGLLEVRVRPWSVALVGRAV